MKLEIVCGFSCGISFFDPFFLQLCIYHTQNAVIMGPFVRKRNKLYNFAVNYSNMDLHFIINCIAGFSFLSSAGFMAFIRIPYAPVWRKLRWCKTFLSLTFLVVGLSCSKTVVFGLGSNPNIIQTSTLISASIQSLLFACTGISFLNPTFINRKWIWQNISAILFNAVLLILGLVFWRSYFRISALIAVCVYLSLWTSYQFIFYRLYRQCVANTDSLLDENSEHSYRWIKQFFVAVSALGITACIAPFMPIQVYDCWMLFAAGLYVYVILSFVNYWNHTASMVSSVYQYNQPVPEPVEAEEPDYKEFEEKLQKWIDQKEFVKNDVVSEALAESMDLSIAFFRSYFRNTGKTDFRQWRMKLRIEYACQIMKEHPEYSYDTIAEMTGICDRSNFSKTFKKITGKSPKEYLN